MKWCVEFPEESVLLVRPSLKRLCLDNKPAAKLLSVLLYRYSIRKEAKEDAENQNEVKQARGETPDQDTTFRIFRKQAQLVTDAIDEMDEKTLHDVAVPALQLLGYLDIEEHPGVYCYIVHRDRVQEAINAWKQGPKQLELFLKAIPQLEKVLIAVRLEKVLINKKLFSLELEKVLIANRNISHNKRGRKPRSEAGSGSESADPQIDSEIDSENGNEEEGESAQPLRDGSATHDGTETPPADNVSDFLSESAKLRALKTVSVASVAHSQTAHDELPPDIEDWDDSDRMDSTQEMRAVKIGGQDAAVHAGNDHGAGAGVPLPGHKDADRVPAHPGAAAHLAAAHAAHGDTRSDRLAVPAAAPVAAKEPPDTSLDACSGPLFAGQDGAAPPTGGSLSPSLPASQPRASGASIPPLSVQGERPPTLTRKQQDRLIAQTIAAYWAVIEAWKGQKYSQAQRAQACHTSGLEAMYADGVTPDALTAKLKLLDDFQKRTFNVNRLYLEWWNNLDETQPAKTNGKASRGRPPEDENDPYSFVSILKRQAEQEAASA